MTNFWAAKDIAIFTGIEEAENFRRMPLIYPVRVVRRALRPYSIPSGQLLDLPRIYLFDGDTRDTLAFLAAVDTTGLLVLHDGRLVFERYWLGADATTTSPSFSVAKSFTSALIGCAIAEGRIASVHDPVTKYVPALKGSAYDGASLKQVLQMSSGARWNEAYSDKTSDVFRYSFAMNNAGSLDELAAAMTREFEPGTVHRYNTMDTHVLGMVLRQAAGQSVAEYLQSRLWEPLGAQADAFFMVDGRGMEQCGAGLNAVLRDYARLGLLYLNGGLWNGKRILPQEWIRDSVTPDSPHLMPGRPGAEDSYGYGYQWWVPDLSGAFFAAGVYNQYIYVDPAHALVIAKSSANRAYGTTPFEASNRGAEHLALFRAIAAALG